MNKLVDLTGRQIGKWLVIGLAPRGSVTKWICRCECGNERQVKAETLVNGKGYGCGCYLVKHGESTTKLYICWANMHRRCANPKDKRWERYGGRGISVCERWSVYENFKEDMGPIPKGMQIDRINNDLGYSKENCRWVTPSQNMRNNSQNVLVTYMGVEMTVIEASEKSGIKYDTIMARIKSGWNDVFIPLQKNRSLSKAKKTTGEQ